MYPCPQLSYTLTTMSGHDDGESPKGGDILDEGTYRLHTAFRHEIGHVSTLSYHRLTEIDGRFTRDALRNSDPQEWAKHLGVRHAMRQLGYHPAALPADVEALYAETVKALVGTGDLPTSHIPPPPQGERCSRSDDSSAENLSRSAAP